MLIHLTFLVPLLIFQITIIKILSVVGNTHKLHFKKQLGKTDEKAHKRANSTCASLSLRGV